MERSETVERPGFEPAAVVRFLRSQTAWLCRGLARAETPVEVQMVLETHDSAHATWLSLIAEAERSISAEAALRLSALYSFQGRVIGSLERGPDLRLSHSVARQIRAILATRLDELTEAAIELVAPGHARLRSVPTQRPAAPAAH